ncbi:MAG TPA: hypothetical protein VMG09_01810 [Bacteroidota bacterium]|nr:hypothetical protein [Bacteroidota bacterium]
MSAVDMFTKYVGSLTESEKKSLDAFIKNEQADLFAARSEEARLRIAQRFIASAHSLLKSEKS